MENKLSSGRSLYARLGGGAGTLQNVVNRSNIAFLSCYELTGRLFKAFRVTRATCHYLEKFSPLQSREPCNFFVLY